MFLIFKLCPSRAYSIVIWVFTVPRIRQFYVCTGKCTLHNAFESNNVYAKTQIKETNKKKARRDVYARRTLATANRGNNTTLLALERERIPSFVFFFFVTRDARKISFSLPTETGLKNVGLAKSF